MHNRLLLVITCIIALACPLQAGFSQELEEDQGFIFEEEIEAEFLTELEEQEPEPQYITADVLTQEDIRPALLFYIRSDIDRKFSGLITKLKLEKIYGISQEDKTAVVYFQYSYSSVRNLEIKLMDRGKMTLVRFNSGKWFNSELTIYLMDSYPLDLMKVDDQPTEE